MKPSFGRRVARGAMMAAISLAVAACAGRQDPGDAEVEIRGTDPSGGSSASASRAPAARPLPDGAGIVAYDGYAAARAQEGDTVSTLASRVGLSASELGAYNGLAPTHQLRAGDELVLPPRPGGYVATAAPAPDLAPAAVPVSGIESQPLDASGAGLPTTTGTEIAAADPATAPLPADSGWSPELIAGAIDRTGGPETPQTETPGQGVALPAPPSAGDPLPPEPSGTETLQSPQLSQYQTSRPDETVVARAPDPSVDPVPVPTPAPADALPVASDSDPATSEVAAATPAPAAAAPTTRLQRPVQGEVALGFREGAGGVKNDGVDFAAPAGAPVVAAEAGEVALVSEALGGLGTIVLLRHPGELLTVYGRISGVTVSKGDIVERGQQIGEVAQPDGGVAPRMHFEVREGAASVDPMRYI